MCRLRSTAKLTNYRKMESTFQNFENYCKRNFHRTSSFFQGLVFVFVDAITLFLCVGIGFFIVNFVNNSFINFRSFVEYYIYIPMIIVVFYAADLYPGIMTSPAEDVKRFFICTFFGFAGIAISIFVEDAEDKVAIAVALVLAIPFATILLPGMREVARRFCGKLKFWGLPVVVYCSGNSGDEIIERFLEKTYLGYLPALIVNDGDFPQNRNSKIPMVAPSQDLIRVIKKQKIKVAIIAGYKSSVDEIMKNFRYTIVISDTQNMLMSGTPHLRDIGGIVGFSCTHNLTKKSHLAVKRIIDLAIIFFTLPLVLPVSLIIALLVRITSPGPVLYGHGRIGKNHKQIKCWKFRSMYKDADEKLESILKENPEMRQQWEKDRKIENDPRVTPFGKFIRKTSLDELPQLINIFFGQMSFVGPRPVTESELVRYGDNADYFLSVTPGLSGMWQTSGRSDTAYEDRVVLDTYYIQNWSIWLDLWILIKTVWVVLGRKGAY